MVLADVVDAADVAVRHLARDAHLGVELGEPLRVLGDGGRQELQRDVLPEAQILGAVDLADAAAADQAEDAVALGEQGARRQLVVRRAWSGGREPSRARRTLARWARTPGPRLPDWKPVSAREVSSRGEDISASYSRSWSVSGLV